jgi:hypothetical protein
MVQLRPFYERIVYDFLKISDGFLREFALVIRDKLNVAADMVQREGTEIGGIYAINQCLHLAGSLVLHCKSLNLNYALDKVRQVREFFGKNPTTVVTIAMLHHLLKLDMLAETEKDRESREVLFNLFDKKDWLVGGEACEALGIREKDED